MFCEGLWETSLEDAPKQSTYSDGSQNVHTSKKEHEILPLVHKPAKASDNNDAEDLCWTTGNGKNTVLKFHCSALANPPEEPPAKIFHMTYKFVQAETKLVSALLRNHGLREADQSAEDFNLLWTGVHVKAHQLQSLQSHQRVNHFPRSYELTRKDRLYKNIEKVQRIKGPKHFNFVPQTFVLPGDYKELCVAHHRIRGPWIVKPIASSRGRGIYIVNNPEQIPCGETLVVAKYIDDPLLVGGYKCDLRLYVAVTCYDPLIIYLYEEGLVRLATVKYEPSGQHLWNPCMHLCNYSINKYHEDYIMSEDPEAENVGHKWTLSALLRHLKNEGKDTSLMMQHIEDVIVKAILAAAPTIVAASRFVPHRNTCFELYGFDILIDSLLKPWLLEINLSPSLACDSPLDTRIKSALLADLLTLAGLPVVDPVVKHPPKVSGDPTQQSRRIMSADTARAQDVGKAGRKLSSCSSVLGLSNEEIRLIRSIRAEFARRGGFLRIFPSPDSWKRYASFLDPLTGLLNLGSQISQKAVVPHNLNLMVHQQLYPELEVTPVDRLSKYERALSRGFKSLLNEPCLTGYHSLGLAINNNNKYPNNTNGNKKNDKYICGSNHETNQEKELKMEVKRLLESGNQLSTFQARRAFAQYLQQILAKLGPCPVEGTNTASELCLKFLQKASANLRAPFIVKVPSVKLGSKDRVAVIAKQLNEFLQMYVRETELFYPNLQPCKQIRNGLFQSFLQVATESDLEEILTLQLKLYKCAHVFLGRCSTPPPDLRPQDLLYFLPQMCSFSSSKASDCCCRNIFSRSLPRSSKVRKAPLSRDLTNML